MCVCVCVRQTQIRTHILALCVQYNIFFPFIGNCGVCGKMSVAHFHTAIVSQWASRCGGYSPWFRFHHIIHERCRGTETDCCVGLPVCERDKEEVAVVSFLYFSCDYSVGNRPAPSLPSRRQQPDIAPGTTHLSTDRGSQAISSPLISVGCWMMN